ncbi:DUF58 domain-containing protein [Deinococcus sp.]|uniref:DUF58 domain-containing protein n=1 Tax=Deinococcus sp. TaxID=47478 RepID=UPI0025EA08D0|nr:DUF58 domain-containing protein [Deinococcus sp.]
MLLTLLYAGLLLLMLAAVWALWRRAPGAELVRELPAQGFEGRSTEMTVRLTLSTRLPTRVRLDDPAPLSVVPESSLGVGGLVWGRESIEHRTRLTLGRRGEFEWAPPRLHWADPFGLFWRSAELPADSSTVSRLTVYPGTHALSLPALLRPLLSEGELSQALGLDDPISLRGARPYVPGDPPGRIHWRLSARTGSVMVRELERTAQSSLQLHLDRSGGEIYLDSAVRLAASLVREALELGLPVSVSDDAGTSPPGSSPEALQLALSRLARMQPTSAGQALSIPTPRPGSNLIVLTKTAPEPLVRAAMLARAGASRVVIVAIPEGFYLEPGESPRRQWAGLPPQLKKLEARAGVLQGAGVLVFVLRGNMSVIRLGG